MLIGLEFEPENLFPPFEARLPARLRQFGERALLESHSLTRETYATRRFLSGDPSQRDAALFAVPIADGFFLRCEAASPEVIRYSTERDLVLANDEDSKMAAGLVQDALSEVIQHCPSLLAAVSQVAWRFHVVLAQDDDYDVSFSDPAIPFSVFVSAPARRDRRSVLRVAENLVHEAMHLQLTLFEGVCPLVNSDSSLSMYSPWKGEERPAQGILHGIYVFSVLRWMWKQICQTAVCETDRDFALHRVDQIDEEVSFVRALVNSPALTEAGNLFLNSLFEKF